MALSNPNKSVWSGISFPPRRDGFAGFFAVSTDLDLIRENLYVLLNTRKGEMVMNPDFGNTAYDMLFEPITSGSQIVICQHIKEDIEKYEPRLTVKSVAIYSRDNECIIDLTLLIKLTNESVNLNYSFAV